MDKKDIKNNTQVNNLNSKSKSVDFVDSMANGKNRIKDGLARGVFRGIDNIANDIQNSNSGYESEDEYGNKKQQNNDSHFAENTYDLSKKVRQLLKKEGEEGATKKAPKGLFQKLGKIFAKKGATTGAGAAGTGATGVAATTTGMPAILVILLIIIVILIIFYLVKIFKTSDFEEESKKNDTSAVNAIVLMNEKKEIINMYDELIANATSEEEKMLLKIERDNILTSDAFNTLKSEEGIDEGYLVLNSSKRIYQNISKLTYASDLYLDWEPEYSKSKTNICRISKQIYDENMQMLIPICNEIGEKYSIDPMVLVAIIEVESGGNFHYNQNGSINYKGLVGMPEDFNLFFENGEKEYFYTSVDRCPIDLGICMIEDVNHRNNARFQIEYLARRLTGAMAFFFQDYYNIDYVVGTITADKLRDAVLYAITAYNQGEYLQMDLYSTYHDLCDVYGNEGKNYTALFKNSMVSSNKKYGNKLEKAKYTDGYMYEVDNSTYLERVYDAYKKYSNKNLDDTVSNFDYSKLSTNWYPNHFAFTRTYFSGGNDLESFSDVVYGEKQDGIITLSQENENRERLEEIKTNSIEKEKEKTVELYNKWMKMTDDYYLKNYANSFIYDEGKLVPEIYAKDKNGNITDEVIKHKSYLHNVVSKIDNYDINKKFSSGNIDKDYKDLDKYLKSETLDIPQPTKVEYKIKEELSGLEKDYAIDSSIITKKILKDLDVGNNITSDESIDLVVDKLSKYLSYTIPLYEYVTLDDSLAKKSFLEEDLYSASAYDNLVLKFDNEKFKSNLLSFTNDNNSIKDFVNGNISEEQLEKNADNLYRLMYLNSNKLFESKNHNYTLLKSNYENYYLKIGNKYCDEYVENITVDEIYESEYDKSIITEEKNPNSLARTYIDEFKSISASQMEKELLYNGLEVDIAKQIITDNLKPQKFTSVLQDEVTTFSYNTVETGSRDVRTQSPTTIYQKADIINVDAFGNEQVVDTIYRKVVTRSAAYYLGKEKVKTTVERS